LLWRYNGATMHPAGPDFVYPLCNT